MPQSVNRRSVAAAIGAAAVAIPTTCLADRGVEAVGHGVTELEVAIGRYRGELALINSSGELSDDEIDAWVDRADAMLEEAYRLPVLNASAAVAVIDLILAEKEIGSHSTYGHRFVRLAKSARNYIVSTGRQA